MVGAIRPLRDFGSARFVGFGDVSRPGLLVVAAPSPRSDSGDLLTRGTSDLSAAGRLRRRRPLSRLRPWRDRDSAQGNLLYNYRLRKFRRVGVSLEAARFVFPRRLRVGLDDDSGSGANDQVCRADEAHASAMVEETGGPVW